MKTNVNHPYRTGLIFFSVVILITIVTAFFISRKGENRRFFSISVVFKSASGLQPGYKVLFNGVSVGNVEAIRILGAGSVRIMMNIDTSYRRLIYKNARASIGSEGLMGNNLVSISPGVGISEPVAPNGELEGVNPVDYDRMLKKASALGKNISIVFADFQDVSKHLNNGNGSVASLMNNKAIRTELKSTVKTAKKTIHRIKKTTRVFQK